jgi:large subunit ribosomal protein L18
MQPINRHRIHRKIRKSIAGTSLRPRLSVYRSLTAIYSQLIDDELGKTLTQASSKGLSGSLSVKAKQVGAQIATQAKELKISQAVFDRGGFRYLGAVKAVGDAAREGGLEI